MGKETQHSTTLNNCDLRTYVVYDEVTADTINTIAEGLQDAIKGLSTLANLYANTQQKESVNKITKLGSAPKDEV